jgi:hypothetical protein
VHHTLSGAFAALQELDEGIRPHAAARRTFTRRRTTSAARPAPAWVGAFERARGGHNACGAAQPPLSRPTTRRLRIITGTVGEIYGIGGGTVLDGQPQVGEYLT